jgi:hypothetical protein
MAVGVAEGTAAVAGIPVEADTTAAADFTEPPSLPEEALTSAVATVVI